MGLEVATGREEADPGQEDLEEDRSNVHPDQGQVDVSGTGHHRITLQHTTRLSSNGAQWPPLGA